MGPRSSNNGNDRLRELDDEIERYRKAAETALGQLEWIVGYLHKIRRGNIARAVDRNRKQIIEEMRELR
jgi:predicted ribosome quality control (RQC) complex YloA/Tae2 family protein